MLKEPNKKGFTLIEIAITVAVLGLLIVWVTGIFGTLIKRNKLNETRQLVKSAKEALIGFAIKNNRFPCPDTNGDGQEDCPYSPPSPDPATDKYKNTKLPYVTIGIKGKDTYLKQIYYDVNVALTTTSSGYNFCVTARNILLNPSWPDPPRITLNEGNSYSPAAAIVLSTSENMSLDPSINNNDDVRSYETKGITSNFDDIVEWIDLGTILTEKNCQDCTSYTIYNWDETGGSGGIGKVYVRGGIYEKCTEINPGAAFNVRLGDVVVVYSDSLCTTFIFYPSETQIPGGQATATVTYWKAQELDSKEKEGWGTPKNDCKVNAKHGIT